MPKEIKKCYNNLNLSFTSTIEQIKEREKILIKLLRAKAIKHGKSYKEKINKVVGDANTLVDYVNKNGIPNKTDFSFEISNNDLISQILVVITFGIMLFSLINMLT